MYRHKSLPYVFGAGLFLLERGLDVSGIQNVPLAVGLWAASGGFLLTGAILTLWPLLQKVRVPRLRRGNLLYQHLVDSGLQGPGKSNTLAVGVPSVRAYLTETDLLWELPSVMFVNRTTQPMSLDVVFKYIVEMEPDRTKELRLVPVNEQGLKLAQNLLDCTFTDALTQMPINLPAKTALTGTLIFLGRDWARAGAIGVLAEDAVVILGDNDSVRLQEGTSVLAVTENISGGSFDLHIPGQH